MAAKSPIVLSRRRALPTDEELMALPKDGYKRELLNGEIVMSPAGSEHGRLIIRFASALAIYVYQHKLGEVFDGQTGFRMKSRDVLSPDISFVATERLAGLQQAPEGFFEGSADLAIEFLSTGDSMRRLKEKLIQYFDNGTRLAWVMNSRSKTIAVHRAGEAQHTLSEADDLSGEEVVPGFRIQIATVFAGLQPPR